MASCSSSRLEMSRNQDNASTRPSPPREFVSSCPTPNPSIRRNTQQHHDRLTRPSQHHFPRLPPELRLKIWAYALPPPRLVPIKYGAPTTISPTAALSLGPSLGYTSTAPIPALLHACTESRAEARRHYGLMLGIARQPGRVFLDPERDVLYFGPRDGYAASAAQLRTLLALADPAELARLRCVALNHALFFVDCTCGCEGATSLAAEIVNLLRCHMPGLREVVFVPRDDNPVYAAGEAALVLPPEDAESGPSGAGMKGMVGVVHEAVESVRRWEPGWTVGWRVMCLGYRTGSDR
jgi:hypothetical protein